MSPRYASSACSCTHKQHQPHSRAMLFSFRMSLHACVTAGLCWHADQSSLPLNTAQLQPNYLPCIWPRSCSPAGPPARAGRWDPVRNQSGREACGPPAKMQKIKCMPQKMQQKMHVAAHRSRLTAVAAPAHADAGSTAALPAQPRTWLSLQCTTGRTPAGQVLTAASRASFSDSPPGQKRWWWKSNTRGTPHRPCRKSRSFREKEFGMSSFSTARQAEGERQWAHGAV